MCNYAGGKTEDERMCIRRQRIFSMDNVTLKKVTLCNHLKCNIDRKRVVLRHALPLLLHLGPPLHVRHPRRHLLPCGGPQVRNRLSPGNS